ncbi:hypothetical protein Y032_0005g2519 [Ancylostoma ceylanicum]|nr:hypothetical protein Y032_0005g2519 [Ancylostoma ceylanicum]
MNESHLKEKIVLCTVNLFVNHFTISQSDRLWNYVTVTKYATIGKNIEDVGDIVKPRNLFTFEKSRDNGSKSFPRQRYTVQIRKKPC